MEKYYVIKPECGFYKQVFDYLENAQIVNKLFKQFSHDMEIESNLYYASNDTVSIVPTAKDKEKFANQFKKYADGATGLMFFKQNSRVYKEWISLLKKNNLKVKSRPQPGFYFGIWGKGSSRLFEHDGKLYMSLNYNQDFEDPQDCEPILGSEFYKVLEELEHNKKK